jgi:hypothetical protein
MKAKILLRIAAGLVLIHLLGHSVGHMGWDKPKDPKMQEVVNAMKTYKADFMGASKSMGDYYNGYSLVLFFVYGMSICIILFSSGFINEQTVIAKKILYPVGITYSCFGIIEFLYFFPFAASMSLGAGLLILFSLLTFKSTVR